MSLAEGNPQALAASGRSSTSEFRPSVFVNSRAVRGVRHVPKCFSRLVVIVTASQQSIIEIQGEERSTGERLSSAMNEAMKGVQASGTWTGFVIDTMSDSRRVFDYLLERAPFITTLLTFPGDLHMVVVDRVDEDGFVRIRDPYDKTDYKMTWDAFGDAWRGMSAWWSEGGK